MSFINIWIMSARVGSINTTTVVHTATMIIVVKFSLLFLTINEELKIMTEARIHKIKLRLKIFFNI